MADLGGTGGTSGIGKTTKVDISTPKTDKAAKTPSKPDDSGFKASQAQNKAQMSPSKSQQKLTSAADTKNPMNQKSVTNEATANKAGSTKLTKQEQTQAKNQEHIKKEGKLTKAGNKPEYDVVKDPALAQNPVLAAKKEKALKNKAKSKKSGDKKAPPDPSMNTKMRNKGPLRPRVGVGKLPGRLGQLRSDKPIDHLGELKEALGAMSAHEDPNLITQYSKKLLEGAKALFPDSKNLAQVLGFDESVSFFDRETLHLFLTGALDNTELSEEAKSFLKEILAQVTDPNTSLLKPLTLLFLPFPFPYTYFDIDEEFIEDEEHFYDEDEEEGRKEDSGEGEEDAGGEGQGEGSQQGSDFKPDIEASMSIKALNYGKLHIKLKHNPETNQMHMAVKADDSAHELAIALESNLEAKMLEEGATLKPDALRNWHDNVLRITESRNLQIQSEGQLNPAFLKACNSILETIHDNDGEEEFKDSLEADYKVL